MTKSKAQAALDAAKKKGETKVSPKRTFQCSEEVAQLVSKKHSLQLKADVFRRGSSLMCLILCAYYTLQAYKCDRRMWVKINKEVPQTKGVDASVNIAGVVTVNY